MFIPKLPHVGLCKVKDLKIGQFFSSSSPSHFLRKHIQVLCSYYLQPLGISTTRSYFSWANFDGRKQSFPYLLTHTHTPTLKFHRTETQTFHGRFSTPLAYLKVHTFSTAATDKEIDVHENENKETISVTFVDKDGNENLIKVPVGMSMLEAAHENDIELEGACEGSLACSTCHVIVMDVEHYNKLEEPTDEENDMLDLAFGLTETSRLGCQVIAKPELDGLRLALPAATRNFAVDGYVPKPH